MGPRQQPDGQPDRLAGDRPATLRGTLPRTDDPDTSFRRVAVRACRAPAAQHATVGLQAWYPTGDSDTADVVVALGGDGFLLAMLHHQLGHGTPVYGMHRGSIGSLMSEHREDDLFERPRQATLTTWRPLAMELTAVDVAQATALARNEVALHRSTHRAARVRISVDGVVRIPELIADGVLVPTPAGSTAYDLPAHGPILPVDPPLLALTTACACRPRRRPGALPPCQTEIRFDVLEAAKRPVAAAADDRRPRRRSTWWSVRTRPVPSACRSTGGTTSMNASSRSSPPSAHQRSEDV